MRPPRERGPVGGAPVALLVAAGAAAWEPLALEVVTANRSLTLVKRCLDLTDLLATAGSGTARAAVVSDRLPGLDADSVALLRHHGVAVVAVVASDDPESSRDRAAEDVTSRTSRLHRIGVTRVLHDDAVPELAAVLHEAVTDQGPAEPAAVPRDHGAAPVPDHLEDPLGLLGAGTAARGRVVAVWGPTGAPGRTTLAVHLAAELAEAGRRVCLVDADAYGGAAAQHLAVLDGASGLLAATRLANHGQLDRVRLAGVARQVAPRLRIVSGLPRADRWAEVRPVAFEELLEVARALDEVVVVDTGFGLPTEPADPFGGPPPRDELTRVALTLADHVVVVASADPVGLTRLTRSLQDLDALAELPVHVVVNRMRSGLGWTEREVAALVARVCPRAPVTFLPYDRSATDRALVSGRTLAECGDSALRRALAVLADRLDDVPAGRRAGARHATPRWRRRRHARR